MSISAEDSCDLLPTPPSINHMHSLVNAHITPSGLCCGYWLSDVLRYLALIQKKQAIQRRFVYVTRSHEVWVHEWMCVCIVINQQTRPKDDDWSAQVSCHSCTRLTYGKRMPVSLYSGCLTNKSTVTTTARSWLQFSLCSVDFTGNMCKRTGCSWQLYQQQKP